MIDAAQSRRGRRIIITFGAVVLVGFALWFSHGLLYSRLMEETRQVSLERLRFTAALVERHPELLRNNLLMSFAGGRQARLSYIDAEGRVLGDSDLPQEELGRLDNHKDRLEIMQAGRDGYGFAVRNSATLNSETVYTALRLPEGGFLRLAVPFAPVNKSINEHFIFLLGLSAVLLGVTAALFISDRRIFQKDLGELGKAVAAIAGGNYKLPVSSLGREELRPLAADINSLARDIRAALAEAADKGCRLQTIFDSIKEGVAIFDGEGDVRAHNAVFIRFFPACAAKERQQAIGCIPIPRLQKSIERILEGEVPEEYSFRTVGEGGRQLLLSVYEPVNPAPDVRVVLVVQDITELMRLERAQADFAANVSHELRTPLTAVKGYAEILQEGRCTEEEGRAFAGKIARHADMLHSLVEELLSLAALDASAPEGESETVSLEECAGEARRLVAESGKYDREIVVEKEEAGSCPVRVNKALMVQAVRNLLENACAYAPEGTKVRAVVSRGAGGCVFLVSDQGPGIPEEAQERIFERFFRLEKKRTGGHSGLGLAISRQIVERFAGSLRVESPGREASTTFILQLPSAGEIPPASEETCA